jgi:hypothetical protein
MLNNLAGGSKDLPTEIRALFCEFKPYKGGNNTLWGLNELCNTPKHKMLYPVAIGSGNITVNASYSLNADAIKEPVWDREKNEIKFATIRPGGQVISHLNTSFAIVLSGSMRLFAASSRLRHSTLWQAKSSASSWLLKRSAAALNCSKSGTPPVGIIVLDYIPSHAISAPSPLTEGVFMRRLEYGVRSGARGLPRKQGSGRLRGHRPSQLRGTACKGWTRAG